MGCDRSLLEALHQGQRTEGSQWRHRRLWRQGHQAVDGRCGQPLPGSGEGCGQALFDGHRERGGLSGGP